MQTVKKKLSELYKTKKNIRKHSPKQIEEYIRSLKMFGQIRPLVVAEDGEILVGNGMYEALLQMGAEECDVYVVNGLTAAQKKKLMLADNKVYDLGVNDIAILDDILKDLDGDFDVPGYNTDLLETLFSADEEETGAAAMDYGAHDFDISKEQKNDTPVTFSQAGTTQYAPPVRQSDGGFSDPASETAHVQPDRSDGKYMICPHCGEKIWL